MCVKNVSGEVMVFVQICEKSENIFGIMKQIMEIKDFLQKKGMRKREC